MKKSFLAVLLISAFVMALSLSACGGGAKSSSEASSGASTEASSEAVSEAASEAAPKAAVDVSAYGYAGDDSTEAAVYKYLVEEVSKNFDKADVSIPTVSIVNVDTSNPDEPLVAGDFWIDNYTINDDTLECVSGGNFPGVMHLAKDGEGYTVSSFDVVEDGANFDSSAKELFGDNYDAFMKIHSDDEARNELRTATISDYVKLNGLDVTKYQDYGWDPVELNK